MGFRELARDVARELRGHGYSAADLGFVVLFTREKDRRGGGYLLLGRDQFETGQYLNFNPPSLADATLIPEAVIPYMDGRRIKHYTGNGQGIPLLHQLVENARAMHDARTHLIKA